MILMTESCIREMSIRNKKFLIWNFMDELCDKYKEAHSKHVPTVFKIQDFKSFNLPIFSQDKSFIFKILNEYEQANGFIKINDNNVALTTKGLLRLMLAQRDWD